MSDSNSETSSQIIPSKARAAIRAEFRPWRPLAFELQGREYAARGSVLPDLQQALSTDVGHRSASPRRHELAAISCTPRPVMRRHASSNLAGRSEEALIEMYLAGVSGLIEAGEVCLWARPAQPSRSTEVLGKPCSLMYFSSTFLLCSLRASLLNKSPNFQAGTTAIIPVFRWTRNPVASAESQTGSQSRM
jgi:hypothetical protein